MERQNIYIPYPRRRTRLLTLAYGLTLFLWFSWEDNYVWPVAAFGVGLSLLLVALTVMNKLGGRMISGRYVPLTAVVLGALVGLGGAIATTGLMFFKNALHAHLFFDYPAQLMLAMLERAPIWGLAGALVGFGGGLLWLAARPASSGIEAE